MTTVKICFEKEKKKASVILMSVPSNPQTKLSSPFQIQPVEYSIYNTCQENMIIF